MDHQSALVWNSYRKHNNENTMNKNNLLCCDSIIIAILTDSNIILLQKVVNIIKFIPQLLISKCKVHQISF